MVLHQWTADCRYGIRLRVDCYSGETAGHRSLGTHTPPCLPEQLCHEAWAHERRSAAALSYRKRGLPTRSGTRTVQAGLGGPGRCGQPKQSEGERTGLSEGRKRAPSICLSARAPVGSLRQGLLVPIRLGVATGDGGDEPGGGGGRRLGMLQKGDYSTTPLSCPPMHVI